MLIGLTALHVMFTPYSHTIGMRDTLLFIGPRDASTALTTDLFLRKSTVDLPCVQTTEFLSFARPEDGALRSHWRGPGIGSPCRLTQERPSDGGLMYDRLEGAATPDGPHFAVQSSLPNALVAAAARRQRFSTTAAGRLRLTWRDVSHSPTTQPPLLLSVPVVAPAALPRRLSCCTGGYPKAPRTVRNMGGESWRSRSVPGWGKSPKASNTPPTAATCWKNARSR